MTTTHPPAQASDEPMRADDHCPACGGSGHSMMLSGGGPDAQEQFADCPYCCGTGGLLDAYNGTRDLLAAEKQKNIELICRLALVDEPKQAPRATADVERDAIVGDLAMLVRTLVHSLKKANPDSDLAARAVDYLQRKGLSGSPLRATKGAKP